MADEPNNWLQAMLAPPAPRYPKNSLASLLSGIAPAPTHTRLTDLIPAVQPAPKGIWFDRTNGEKIRFSEPAYFPGILAAPLIAGLYVILAPDASRFPRQFRELYFGEAESLKERVKRSHEKYAEWCRVANGAANLRVAYHWMLGSSKQARTTVEEGLVRHYNPPCNVTFNALAALFGGPL